MGAYIAPILMFSLKMKTHISYIIIIVILVAVFFMLWNKKTPKKEIVITEKRDTVLVHDTVTFYKPTPVYIESKPDTVYLPSLDTTAVMDKEVKVYEDSLYSAQISGFQPQLDWIKVYPKTTIITETKEVKSVKKQQITHGVQVGIGYGIINKKADLYVGYGIQYNF